MKAEHRKELETNVLVHQLEKAYQGIRQGPSRTTLLWVGAAVVVLVVYLLFRYFMTSSEATTSERWLKLDSIIFPDQLTKVLSEDDLKDTEQGRLARFKEARMNLREGMRVLGSNPTEGVEKIETATKAYEELAQSPGRVPLLHQEALSGAARGYEALGDTENAAKFYKKLAGEYPTSALGKDAKKQYDRLEDPNNQAEIAALKKAFSATRSGKSE
jgi:hypothetical protein